MGFRFKCNVFLLCSYRMCMGSAFCQPKCRRNIFCVPLASQHYKRLQHGNVLVAKRAVWSIFFTHVKWLKAFETMFFLHSVINTINTWGEKWRVKGKGSGNCDQKTKSIRDSFGRELQFTKLRTGKRESISRGLATPPVASPTRNYFIMSRWTEYKGFMPSSDLIFSPFKKRKRSVLPHPTHIFGACGSDNWIQIDFYVTATLTFHSSEIRDFHALMYLPRTHAKNVAVNSQLARPRLAF